MIKSTLQEAGHITFPEFAGTRVMMMPIVIGDAASLPDDVLPAGWHDPIGQLSEIATSKRPEVAGCVGYLTIDEAVIREGLTHRRPGLHTDGYAAFSEGAQAYGAWGGFPGPWATHEPEHREPEPPEEPRRHYGAWGGFPGPWATTNSLGMLSASSVVGCEAFHQTFDGQSGSNGDCSHLADQLDRDSRVVLEPNVVYAMDGDTVHRSLVHTEQEARQFVRLSMPSDAAWYEGYTRNPLGVEPTGPVLPERTAFMGWGDQHL